MKKKTPEKLKKPMFFIDKDNNIKRLNIDGTVDEFIERYKYNEVNSNAINFKFDNHNLKIELEKLKGYHEHLSLCHANLKSLHHDVKTLCDKALRSAYNLCDDPTKELIKRAVNYMTDSGAVQLDKYVGFDKESDGF
jgi:hypothetical protein